MIGPLQRHWCPNNHTQHQTLQHCGHSNGVRQLLITARTATWRRDRFWHRLLPIGNPKMKTSEFHFLYINTWLFINATVTQFYKHIFVRTYQFVAVDINWKGKLDITCRLLDRFSTWLTSCDWHLWSNRHSISTSVLCWCDSVTNGRSFVPETI